MNSWRQKTKTKTKTKTTTTKNKQTHKQTNNTQKQKQNKPHNKMSKRDCQFGYGHLWSPMPVVAEH